MNHQMGDLPGHIFPGLAFVAWAALWCVVLLRRGNQAATLPLESWAKILIPLVEMGGELRWIGYPDVRATIYAHIAADVAVILSGVADLLTRRGRLPKGADRIALALALLIPAALFAVHDQHGPVATTAHRLFATALFAAGAFVLIENFRPAPIVRWARLYCVALAGMWFMHTGWMLYVAQYDLMSDALVPRIYLSFTWYALALAGLLAAVLAARRRALTP